MHVSLALDAVLFTEWCWLAGGWGAAVCSIPRGGAGFRCMYSIAAVDRMSGAAGLALVLGRKEAVRGRLMRGSNDGLMVSWRSNRLCELLVSDVG